MDERIFLLLVYITELAYVLVGMRGLFGCRLIRKWLTVAFFVGYAFLIYLLPMTYNEKLVGCIGMLGFMLIYTSCLLTICSEKMNTIWWLVCRLLILIYIDELLFMCIESVLTLFKVDTVGYGIYLPINVINIIILRGVVVVCKKHSSSSFLMEYTMNLKKSMMPLLFFFAVEIMLLTIGISSWLKEKSDLFSQIYGIVLGLLSMLSIGVFVIIVLYIKKSNGQLEELLVMEQQMKQYQKDYYTALLEKENATRKYRHDMNSHLICLGQLADNEDIEGVKQYIKEMNCSMQQICSLTYRTGLDILDVLMNHYCVYADKDMTISVSGECSGQIRISTVDQCIIFSNLIRNALDALKDVTEKNKRFGIRVEETKEQVQITITNSFDPERIFINENGKLQTTKTDKINHGIGMSNVKEAINKNSGKFNYSIERNQFCCEVTLPKQ